MYMHGTNVGGTRIMEQDIKSKFAYLAGLFDGEGNITYKKYWEDKPKGRYKCWRIQMEIVMTHKPTVQWCCDTFGGNLREKPRKGHKMQYRWRRGFREAYEIAKIIAPHAITKKEELINIINHYKIDRDRGTNPATGVSLDLSDDAQASDESRRLKARVPFAAEGL